MEYRSVTFTPGLYKIFDEILVNAADNGVRCKTQTEIKVVIDREQKFISVYNDGEGIPVIVHDEHKIYIPDMIFGHLLTGSNFDDDEKKIVGGRNGYGAKLANIYSTKFVCECVDSKRGLSFRMVWNDNMSKKSAPDVKKGTFKKDFVKITFYPDLSRFNMASFDDDLIALFNKRVYDIAGCSPKAVRVSLNGEKVPIKEFKDYVDLYIANNSGDAVPKVYITPSERWEIVLSTSPDGNFHQVSFCNSICTTKGGVHVDRIVNQIVDHLQKLVTKDKNFKDAKLKSNVVKQNLWVFVRCAIENPTFDSQTKDTMTLKMSKWGSVCDIDEKPLKELCKHGLLEMTLNLMAAKSKNELARGLGAKKGTRLTGIKKLDDANNAGKKDASKCVLILTEGDSAKALAVAGLGVIGRDNYGVFPLRGKVLNVREATNEKVKGNEEISNLMRIMGLVPNKTHQISELRYGSIMIMTDQDFDGSHIKGLIINFIHKFWPGLLKQPGFIKEFITPVIKAFKKSNAKESKSFYTMPEFDNWYRNTVNVRKIWRLKYYKGLGTSTSAEAKDYFGDLKKHKIDFRHSGEAVDADIELAFDRKKADQRKVWLANLDYDNTFIDTTHGHINYSEFVHKELILFSNYTNIRSLPSMCDGFKPGQRKIVYTMLKMGSTGELKVAQLAGKVSERAAYHHGEVSLQETIIKLAQDYVGSNNLNLLQPLGQFGTRLMGGSDSASSRYIYTKLQPITRLIFRDEDRYILKYCEDDGMVVEPEFFVPIIPMVLINGAQGIGTGWSTNVPNFNPKDLINNIKRLLNGENIVKMQPWYRGFIGEVNQVDATRYRTTGLFNEVDNDVLVVKELPIGKWTHDYKTDFLENNLVAKNGHIEEYFDDGDEHRVKLEVHMESGALDAIKGGRGGVTNWFNLESDINYTNMVLYSSNKKIYKYDSPESILQEFYTVRLQYYVMRKAWMIKKLEYDCLIASNKKRFISSQLDGSLVIHRRDILDVNATLKNMKFTTQLELNKLLDYLERNVKAVSVVDPDEDDDENKEEKDLEAKEGEYDYLMNMSIKSFTNKKIRDLTETLSKLQQELEAIQSKTEKELWIADLTELEEAYDKFVEKWDKDHVPQDKKKNNKIRNVKKNKAVKKDNDKDKERKIKAKKLPGHEDDDKTQKKKKERDNSQDSGTDKENDDKTAEKTKKKQNRKKNVDDEENVVKKDKKKKEKKEKKEKEDEDINKKEKPKKKQNKKQVKSETESSEGFIVSESESEDLNDSFVIEKKKKELKNRMNKMIED